MNWLKDFLKKVMPEKAAEIDQLQIPDPVKESTQEKPAPVNYQSEEITTLKAEIKTLTQMITDLGKNYEAEKIARETTYKKMQSEKVAKAVEDAIKEGKITPEQKEKWQQRLEKDFEGSTELLAEIKANPAVIKDQPGSKTKTGPVIETFQKTGDPIKDTILATGNIIPN